MLKKLFCLLLTILSVITFTSCNFANNESSQTTQTPDQTTIKDSSTTDEKFVWVLSSNGRFPADVDEPTLVPIGEDDYNYEECSAINKLLKEKGFNIEIEFVNLCIPRFSEDYLMEYRNTIDEMIKNGTKIDIVNFCGQSMQSFQDISKYYETENGTNLKQSVDTRVWDLLGENSKYLIPRKKSPFGEQRGYMVNKKLLETYQIDSKDLQKPLEDLKPLFEKIKEEEKETLQPNGQPITCISIPDDWSYASPAYADYAVIDAETDSESFLVIDKRVKNGKIENLFENQEFIDYFHLLKNWKDQGLINNAGNFSNGLSLMAPSAAVSFARELMKEDNDYILVPAGGDCWLESENGTLSSGIAKTCTNPELAFNVLATIVSDSDFSENSSIVRDTKTGNEEMKVYDSMGFFPNWDNLQKEYDAIYKILQNHMSPTIWCAEFDDVDAELAAINRELKAAGLDKFLNELNRQLEEFYQTKQ